MLNTVLIMLVIVLLPRVAVLLCDRFKGFNLLGPVFVCYAAGFLLSFLFDDTSMAATLSEVCVPLAIPMILFSADLTSLKRLAKPALISFALMIVSVAAVCTAANLIFQQRVPEADNINGMLMGLYTGGTPNLMAIGLALGVEQDTILLANTADLIAGGVYFLLLISVMPKLLRAVLPPFSLKNAPKGDAQTESAIEKEYIAKKAPFSFKMLLSRAPVFLLAAASVGVSLGASWLITGNATNIMAVMLGVTTCGVALSFVKRVRETPGSYAAGQYFIYMFSVAIGLTFDVSMINKNTAMLLVMLLFVQFGAVLLHMLLAKVFKIDADTTLITSTAGIYGPAFIPSVAGALKNKEVVLTGLICGILGYAVGNYLGIGMAELFKLF